MEAQPTCNRQVEGFESLLGLSSWVKWGGVPEWLIGADCKSAALRATQVRILPPPP